MHGYLRLGSIPKLVNLVIRAGLEAKVADEAKRRRAGRRSAASGQSVGLRTCTHPPPPLLPPTLGQELVEKLQNIQPLEGFQAFIKTSDKRVILTVHSKYTSREVG